MLPVAPRPFTPPVQPTLFDPNPPRLLGLSRVRSLFCDRLNISESTYYDSFRDWIPVVYTRAMPVRGEKGQYRPGSPRVREDVARELVEIAATGEWRAYCEGGLAATRPHLYTGRAAAG